MICETRFIHRQLLQKPDAHCDTNLRLALHKSGAHQPLPLWIPPRDMCSNVQWTSTSRTCILENAAMHRHIQSPQTGLPLWQKSHSARTTSYFASNPPPPIHVTGRPPRLAPPPGLLGAAMAWPACGASVDVTTAERMIVHSMPECAVQVTTRLVPLRFWLVFWLSTMTYNT